MQQKKLVRHFIVLTFALLSVTVPVLGAGSKDPIVIAKGEIASVQMYTLKCFNIFEMGEAMAKLGYKSQDYERDGKKCAVIAKERLDKAKNVLKALFASDSPKLNALRKMYTQYAEALSKAEIYRSEAASYNARIDSAVRSFQAQIDF